MRNKSSEAATYHRRGGLTVVGPKAELEVLVDLEGSDRMHPADELINVHLEGRNAARVAASGHVAHTVATPLQRTRRVSQAATRSVATRPCSISSPIRAIWRSTSVSVSPGFSDQ